MASGSIQPTVEDYDSDDSIRCNLDVEPRRNSNTDPEEAHPRTFTRSRDVDLRSDSGYSSFTASTRNSGSTFSATSQRSSRWSSAQQELRDSIQPIQSDQEDSKWVATSPPITHRRRRPSVTHARTTPALTIEHDHRRTPQITVVAEPRVRDRRASPRDVTRPPVPVRSSGYDTQNARVVVENSRHSRRQGVVYSTDPQSVRQEDPLKHRLQRRRSINTKDGFSGYSEEETPRISSYHRSRDFQIQRERFEQDEKSRELKWTEQIQQLERLERSNELERLRLHQLEETLKAKEKDVAAAQDRIIQNSGRSEASVVLASRADKQELRVIPGSSSEAESTPGRPLEVQSSRNRTSGKQVQFAEENNEIRLKIDKLAQAGIFINSDIEGCNVRLMPTDTSGIAELIISTGNDTAKNPNHRHEKSSQHLETVHEQSSGGLSDTNILTEKSEDLELNWKNVWNEIPDVWKWDLEYQAIHQTDGKQHGSWICTPMESDEPRMYPLTIASAPVVLPVEYQWPPAAGLNPPPDPNPSTPIDCRSELPLEVIRDLFFTFENSLGFYILISGLIQVIVPDDFDTEWASSHLPHKYGGLKICYIPHTMDPTMRPSTTEIAKPASTSYFTPDPSMPGIFQRMQTSSAYLKPSLKINDFIEARPKSTYRREKYSGRIGLRLLKENEPFLLMSTHIITGAILAKSHREAVFGRTRNYFEKLDENWNEHVGLWAGNEKIGAVHKSFDSNVGVYPNGFRHDVTLVKPDNPTAVRDVASPVSNMGWLNHESWTSLRQQTSAVKILGPTEDHRAAKSIKCSRPSEILVVGEGIFLNQTAAAGSKSLKDHDMSTWKELVSRALLYRVHPDFDPPNGYSGVALYADGVRHDGTEGPGIVGFQSFVQRSGHVQNFEMEGNALDRRLQLGRIAFYGAFEVPEEIKRDYTIA